MATINKAQKGKKIKIGEDSKDYVTKIKTDDKGDVAFIKTRRTVKGLLSGAPLAKKIMKSGGSTPAWTRSEGKDPKGGLNRKGVASYRAANPGSKLKMAVTTKPSKLKAGSKAAGRRKSFCARSAGQMAKFPKAAKDPESRLRLARKKWNC